MQEQGLPTLPILQVLDLHIFILLSDLESIQLSHLNDAVLEECGGTDLPCMIINNSNFTRYQKKNCSIYKFRISFSSMILLLFFLSHVIYGLSGIDGFIDLDLWTEITETITAIDEDNKSYLTDDEISNRVLKDAAWIISGMIYGFDVIYTPLDLSRNVDEYMEVTPVASIPWGDKKLEIIETWVSNGKFLLHVRYFLDNAQTTRLHLWDSNLFPDAEGIGIVSIFSGHQGRVESIKTGIKEALRNYLRSRTTNKPREITCRVLLTEPPYTILDAGGYKSRTNITIKIIEVTPYAYY